MTLSRVFRTLVLAALPIVAACASQPAPRTAATRTSQAMPKQLPDTTWGTQVLVLARDRMGELWVGTYGRGLFVFRSDSARWEQIASKSGDSTSISWNFINSLAFPPDS